MAEMHGDSARFIQKYKTLYGMNSYKKTDDFSFRRWGAIAQHTMPIGQFGKSPVIIHPCNVHAPPV
jgi:hypothetical protein